jgi:DNA-binding NarL/FixJ family response regulator
LENQGSSIDPIAGADLFLIVEDDENYSLWIKNNLIQARPNCVIQIASSREACTKALQMFLPHWALVDLHLPDGSGIEVVKDILDKSPNCKALVITAIEDPEKAILAIQAGAVGYLVKSHSNWVLAEALDEISRGGMPLTPLMAKRVLDTLLPSGRLRTAPELAALEKTPEDQTDNSQLSEREKEILRLASKGYRNKEIASRLSLSPNTVATHIKSIYRKMNIHSRSHLRAATGEDPFL